MILNRYFIKASQYLIYFEGGDSMLKWENIQTKTELEYIIGVLKEKISCLEIANLQSIRYNFISKRPMNDIIQRLKSDGFEGFISVENLMQSRKMVPSYSGVYIILRLKGSEPEFLEQGTGGFFKKKEPRNPNVSIDELRDNWVPNEAIMYIGKATSLKSRLGSYLRFGEGKFATHWGGRYIWQLKDSRELLVCWKETDEIPRIVEEEIIAQFKKEHGGKRPFANLKD